jgi:hypothetical protein
MSKQALRGGKEYVGCIEVVSSRTPFKFCYTCKSRAFIRFVVYAIAIAIGYGATLKAL